ncbi:hypothetical protein NX363_004520 [Salmonella enterica]|nr:hypothetical protein [Salmonella enterica]
MSLQKRLRRLSRITDQKLGILANKCGGAVNLSLITMIFLILILLILMICWGNPYGVIGCIIFLMIMVLAAKNFTNNKIRLSNPWWYRRK